MDVRGTVHFQYGVAFLSRGRMLVSELTPLGETARKKHRARLEHLCQKTQHLPRFQARQPKALT